MCVSNELHLVMNSTNICGNVGKFASVYVFLDTGMGFNKEETHMKTECMEQHALFHLARTSHTRCN